MISTKMLFSESDFLTLGTQASPARHMIVFNDRVYTLQVKNLSAVHLQPYGLGSESTDFLTFVNKGSMNDIVTIVMIKRLENAKILASKADSSLESVELNSAVLLKMSLGAEMRSLITAFKDQVQQPFSMDEFPPELLILGRIMGAMPWDLAKIGSPLRYFLFTDFPETNEAVGWFAAWSDKKKE